jgi:hypothetical protein
VLPTDKRAFSRIIIYNLQNQDINVDRLLLSTSQTLFEFYNVPMMPFITKGPVSCTAFAVSLVPFVSRATPTGTQPGQDLFYLPVIYLLKCILIVQESFILVFQTCIYSAFIRLIPPLLALSVSLCSPIIQ